LEKRTLAEVQSVLESGLSILTGADGEGAIPDTENEILVETQATDITSVATKLLGLLRADHVIGAGLLLES
jgi:hypothetical protein